MQRKTFTFTEDTIEKIESRDKVLYRKEYQFVEAAIQFYSDHGGTGKDLLKKINADVEEIKKAVCKKTDELEVDANGVPINLAKLLE